MEAQKLKGGVIQSACRDLKSKYRKKPYSETHLLSPSFRRSEDFPSRKSFHSAQTGSSPPRGNQNINDKRNHISPIQNRPKIRKFSFIASMW